MDNAVPRILVQLVYGLVLHDPLRAVQQHTAEDQPQAFLKGQILVPALDHVQAWGPPDEPHAVERGLGFVLAEAVRRSG